MVARAWITSIATLGAVALTLAPGAPAAASPHADEPPWLGVAISDGFQGVRVDEVIPDTPADDAGLVPGDEILAVASVRVGSVTGLQATVTSRRVADEVTLTVWRAGRVHTRVATLGPRLSPGEILYRRLVGKPAPHFDAQAVWGQDSGRLEHLRGRVLVLVFMATDCKACGDVLPRLSRLADERARDGIAVVAVSSEARHTLAAWAQREVPSFTVLLDGFGEITRAYRVERVPAIVVVNRDGDVSYAGIGDGENLEHGLFAAERALRGGQPFGP